MRLLPRIAVVLAVVALTACSAFKKTPAVLKPVVAAPVQASHVQPTAAPPVPLASDQVLLSCSGGLGCLFERIDEQDLVAADRGNLEARASLPLRVGRHQVSVQFFPITRARAEKFVMIHDFKVNHTYHVHLYRDRQPEQAASLLAAATPDPLCVELLENAQQIRRFCRPFNPETGLGEFIEQSVAQ